VLDAEHVADHCDGQHELGIERADEPGDRKCAALEMRAGEGAEHADLAERHAEELGVEGACRQHRRTRPAACVTVPGVREDRVDEGGIRSWRLPTIPVASTRPPPFRNNAAHDWRAGVPGLV